MPRSLQLLFFALLAIALGSTLWQHAHLPERVAAHFDATGRANGWLSREAHTALHGATLLFMTALFQGLAALNRRLPKELINLPHRDYWLAPERAAATHDAITATTLQLGCAVFTFFIVLFHFVYRANFVSPPQLDLRIWWTTGTLLIAVFAILARLLLRFRRPVGQP